jgi:hypothetical protein
MRSECSVSFSSVPSEVAEARKQDSELGLGAQRKTVGGSMNN